MRTTVTIDDDVLSAARELAEHQRRSVGAILSDLARQSLTPPPVRTSRLGLPVLPRRNGKIVTSEMIYKLMDEEGI